MKRPISDERMYQAALAGPRSPSACASTPHCALVNKPTKQSVSDLRSALEDLEHALHYVGENCRQTVLNAGDKVKRALTQLTQDDALPCGYPGCTVRKPTKRALSAHAATHPRRS